MYNVHIIRGENTRGTRNSRCQIPPLVQPSHCDVLLGRGRANHGHPGNQRFQGEIKFEQDCE